MWVGVMKLAFAWTEIKVLCRSLTGCFKPRVVVRGADREYGGAY